VPLSLHHSSSKPPNLELETVDNEELSFSLPFSSAPLSIGPYNNTVAAAALSAASDN
jgi:hypothetical protein